MAALPRSGVALREPAIDLGVDAAHEERRDRATRDGRRRRRPAVRSPALVRPDDRVVALEAEDQRHVDVDAPASACLDRPGRPPRVAGILIITLGRPTRPQSQRTLRRASRRCRGPARRHLDRDVPVVPPSLVDRGEHVARGPDVVDDELPVARPRRRGPAPAQPDELGVVRLARADRLLEDRGVRRDARMPCSSTRRCRPPPDEDRAAQVVVPGALAVLDEPGDGLVMCGAPRVRPS